MSVETQLYKKILVACDFSRHARIAFARAVEIAKASNAELLVAHCVSDLAIMPTVSAVSYYILTPPTNKEGYIEGVGGV